MTKKSAKSRFLQVDAHVITAAEYEELPELTDEMLARAKVRNGTRPIHPGEVLREDYLRPLGMSANALAKALHVSAARINGIVREIRGITPDTALRLARFFGGDAQSWMNLQQAYDLKIAEQTAMKTILRDVAPLAAHQGQFKIAA